jgi:tetratricopeptide (TPR) repeat protein
MKVASAIRGTARRMGIGFAAALLLASIVGAVAHETTNAELRHSQAMALVESSERLLALGDPDSALAAVRQAQPILQSLLAAEPDSTLRQHDLSVGDNQLGNALAAQGHVDEALAAYRDSFAIVKALVEKDGRNTDWQHDLSVGDNKIGDLLVGQDRLDEALAAYRDSLGIIKALVEKDRGNTQWQSDLQFGIENVGDMAFRYVLAGEFTKGLGTSDEAISLAPDKIWLIMNRAHALMFLGRVDEARALYLRLRSEKNVEDEKSGETVILEDFAELRKAGLTHPLMDEIEKQFAERG